MISASEKIFNNIIKKVYKYISIYLHKLILIQINYVVFKNLKIPGKNKIVKNSSFNYKIDSVNAEKKIDKKMTYLFFRRFKVEFRREKLQ